MQSLYFYLDYKILYLGCIQSLFEGSMYCFILEWTPALSITGESSESSIDGHRGKIPHGYIFASFMVAMMIGSCAFKVLENKFEIESFMRYILALSFVCLALPFIFEKNQLVLFTGFVIFEVCIGIFWPSMGTLRGKYVPEETRATIMNCFRVPLNLIVVFILCQNFQITLVFKLCTVFLLLSVFFQHLLLGLSRRDNEVEEIHVKIVDSV